MANPNELRKARRREAEAVLSRVRVERLPRRVGGIVEWANGVRWVRMGDDHWESIALPGIRYPSDHVAGGTWADDLPTSPDSGSSS